MCNKYIKGSSDAGVRVPSKLHFDRGSIDVYTIDSCINGEIVPKKRGKREQDVRFTY